MPDVSEAPAPPVPSLEVKPGSREIPRLIERLGSVDPVAHQAAGEHLVRLGAEAAPALRWALRDFEYSLRSRAAEVLTRIGEPAIPVLAEAARDHDAEVRLWAVWALGGIGGDRAGDALMQLPKDPDARVSRTWSRALCQLNRLADLPTPMIERAVKDLDAPAIIPVLLAVSERKSESEKTRILKAALSNPDLDVRFAAAVSLDGFGVSVPYEVVQSVLRSDSRPMRKQAIPLLQRYPAHQAIPCLERLAYDLDTDVAASAVAALGERGGPAAESLCRFLWSYELVRLELNDERGGTLRGSAIAREQSITKALCEIGPDAVPALYEYLSRASRSVWLRGWRAVAMLTAQQPCPELRRLLPLFPSSPIQSSQLTLPEAYFLMDLRRRIEAATEEWKSLPVATADRIAGAEHLPLPANGSNSEVRALPRPTSGTDRDYATPGRLVTWVCSWFRQRLGHRR